MKQLRGARDLLAESGLDRAYVTVANLIRLLVDKGFLAAVNNERPFTYRAVRSFDDVSRSCRRSGPAVVPEWIA